MNAAAAMIQPQPEDAVIPSALLGALTVAENQVFTFDLGIPGFPEARRFALVPTRSDGMFWLQSADFEALTFLVVDPFRFVDEYAVDLGPAELGPLAPQDASEILVLAILTLPRSPGEPATANLQGPLALNLTQRKGRQVILQDSPYDVRHPVALPSQSRARN
jgi:flagellar assembly factor FliW